MKALSDYVIVIEEKSENKENKTSGGIIMTTEVSTGHKPARVIGVGPDVKSVKAGHKCYFNWQESQPFTDDGILMAAVKEDKIFAVFTERDV